MGAVGGLVALALLTTAVDSLAGAAVAFGVSFLFGWVVGLFGAGPVINIASRIEMLRTRADEVRMVSHVLGSAAVAAATSWLLAIATGRL